MTGFDKYLHAILVRGEFEAREDRSATIEAEHLLLAIAGEPESSTNEVLAGVGLDRQAIRDALDKEFEHSLSVAGVAREAFDFPRASVSLQRPKMGASAKLALERGFGSIARKRDLRPAHLLLGIVEARVGTVPRALALAGVDRADLAGRVRRALDGEGE
jgi:ATP-dependent Clp protease ATP-binding subunit ClpA